MNRRRLVLSAIGAGLAVSGISAGSALAATDDELAYANFGHATEFLLKDFYANAAATKVFKGQAAREILRGGFNAAEHAGALGKLLTEAGQTGRGRGGLRVRLAGRHLRLPRLDHEGGTADHREPRRCLHHRGHGRLDRLVSAALREHDSQPRTAGRVSFGHSRLARDRDLVRCPRSRSKPRATQSRRTSDDRRKDEALSSFRGRGAARRRPSRWRAPRPAARKRIR